MASLAISSKQSSSGPSTKRKTLVGKREESDRSMISSGKVSKQGHALRSKTVINIDRIDSKSSGRNRDLSHSDSDASDSSNLSKFSYGRQSSTRRSKGDHPRDKSKNKAQKGQGLEKKMTMAQRQFAAIQDKFKALAHLPKQRLHPFDFLPEELEEMKKLFPEFKPLPDYLPKNRVVKNNGIPIVELVAELKKRIKIDERKFHRMIAQLDRKSDSKVTWNEFLNFLTNEGIRRETVNDAQLYGYGVKRLKHEGRHSLKVVDQYHGGPEKIAEYYIDGMVFIKLKNIKLLLNLFENKEAKLYDLRSLQPIQTLVFQSDYSIPKPKKADNRYKKSTDQYNTTIESLSKSNMQQSFVNLPIMGGEGHDTASVTSFNQMASGVINPMGGEATGENSAMHTITDELLSHQASAGDITIKPRQTSNINKREVSQKKRQVSSALEKNKNKVNFHPPSGNSQTNQKAVQDFADVDIKPYDTQTGEQQKNVTKLSLAKVKSSAANPAIPSSDYGSVSTIAGTRVPRSQSMLQKEDSNSDLHDTTNPIYAWRSKNSRHRQLVRDRMVEEQKKKEFEVKHGSILGISQQRILGIADMASDSALDIIERAKEKSKKQNPNRAKSSMDQEVSIRRELELNREKFNKEIAKHNKTIARHDKAFEANFYEAYQQKEIADRLARDTSFERLETGVGIGGESVSSNAYRSATGSRIGVRRRPTLHKSGTDDRPGSRSLLKDRRPKSKVGTSIINEDINYFGRMDLVERTIRATGYVPLAMKDQESMIKLTDKYLEDLSRENEKCELALKETQRKKNVAMKRVLRVKEANRFFFTQNPLQPPFYFPETSQQEVENMVGSTQESSSIEDADGKPKQITPRTQAKIDYQLLFGENQQPIPCEPGLIKKALEERRIRDMKEQGLTEDPAIARRELLKKQSKENHQMRKIKSTKEIYTVAADFCQTQDGDRSLVALALIDQQILVYQLKQSGVKISLVELFSFYAKFPAKAAVSSLCLDNYVTDRRPIICIGSQNGDIAIYYLDHVNQKGKTCQKLIVQFNFFERGINKDIIDSDSEEAKQVETHKKQKTFVMKVKESGPLSDATRSPSERKRAGKSSEVDFRSESSATESKAGATDGLRLTSQQFSNAIMEASHNVQDDFWEVLLNTRKPKEGPDGITLWNKIYKKIKDQESAITLCKSLIDMKLDSLDSIDEICERWQLCLKMNNGSPKDALPQFEKQMEMIRQEKAKMALLAKRKGQRGANKSANSASAKVNRRQNADLNGSKKNQQSNGAKRADSSKRKNSILNAILEDQLENVSTYGEEPINTEFFVTRPEGTDTQQASGDSLKNKFSIVKKIKNPITKLRYIKDIGLIATSFNGTIKFFDAFNFYQIWKNDNKARAENQHTSVTCFDVSSPLGIMVTGGAEGLLLAIDPHALGVTNQAEAHKGKDILNVFIFEEQQQIISVCEDRTVCLWDAFRLVKLQTIKDNQADNHIPKFTAASFDNQDGSLYVGDQLLQVWKSSVDPIVEINALQIQTLSTAMIKERNLTALMELSNNYQTIKQSPDDRTGSVLISSMSSLVEILIDDQTPQHNYIITVDTENLVRIWNIKEHTTNITFKLPMQKRVTAVDINKLCTYVAVGNTIGEAFVVNSKSGGIIYKLPGADEEVSSIKFLTGQSEFWIVAALWHGKVVFWSQPNEQNNFTINAKVRIGHRGDINSISCQAAYIISGGQDGLLGVWNQFSGVLKYAIKLPEPLDSNLPSQKENMEGAARRINEENMGGSGINPKASSNIRRTVVGLMFHPYWKNVALVLQEGGNVHAVDVSNGMIVNDYLAMVQMNSSWAIDPFNYVMMCVGDQGKAVLFDARMGAKPKLEVKKVKDIFGTDIKEKKQVHTKRVPVYTPSNEKWPILRNWFTAHSFSKTEPIFVNNVKFSKSACLFVTSTNNGEVKLWDCRNCHPMGTLNANSFVPDNVISYIKKVRKTTIACKDATKEVQKAMKATSSQMKELGLDGSLLNIPVGLKLK